MQIYNKKTTAKGKLKNIQFEEKRRTRKWNVGAKSSAQGDKKFKDAKWNKGSGNLRARPYSVKLLKSEKELRESLSSEGNHQKQKADENVLE